MPLVKLLDRSAVLSLLKNLDLGASVAEVDDILYEARIETGTFWDLYKDSVDLVPGTKGSGKSALYRLFVKHLRSYLLEQRKVVLAHGVESQGDQLFQLFTDQFERLPETRFQNFWYVYFVSLINEVLLKSPEYSQLLANCDAEILNFRLQCSRARIPDVKAPQSFKGIIEWCLNAILKLMPRRIQFPVTDDGKQLTLDWGEAVEETDSPGKKDDDSESPLYIADIRSALNAILTKANLTVWLMLDKLDELFPRWSKVERTGLRALLRAMYAFRDERIRVKVFLRDDIFEHLTSGDDGFPGLTHIGARMTSSLNWKIDDIMHLIVKRVFASNELAVACEVDKSRMEANQDYREECFYKAFPEQVHSGTRRPQTLGWIYTRCQDGKKVVTPRDIIDLLLLTRDAEVELLSANPEGTCNSLFSPTAIETGFKKMSQRKRDIFLQAEFPHFREYILRFENGPAIYSEEALAEMFKKQADNIVDQLVRIGFLERKKNGSYTYIVPFLYRPAFGIRQVRSK